MLQLVLPSVGNHSIHMFSVFSGADRDQPQRLGGESSVPAGWEMSVGQVMAPVGSADDEFYVDPIGGSG